MKEIIMPKLGLTMEEGRIVNWVKQEGEPVERGDLLLEIETDKAVNEVESSYTGTVGKIFVQEDETADVLSVIGYILEPGEEPPDEWPAPHSTQKVVFEVGKSDAPVEKTVRVDASPVAQRIARERGVDLMTVTGSGPKGKITKDDVLKAAEPVKPVAEKPKAKISPRARRLAAEQGVPLEEITGSGPGGRIVEDDIQAYLAKGSGQQVSKIKRITAERMTHSFTTTPHFYLNAEFDAGELVAARERLLPEIEAQTGIRLTYSDLFVYLVSRVIPEHSLFSASWDDGELKYAGSINLGLAMAVDAGLMVPAIKDADQKDLAALVAERSQLVEKARNNRLSLEELEGGTFTITNLGMFGIDSFSAILNPPQSAILAIGRIKEKVVPYGNGIVVTPVVEMTLAIDHRVMDGADGARFLQDLRGAVEAPAEYLPMPESA